MPHAHVCPRCCNGYSHDRERCAGQESRICNACWEPTLLGAESAEWRRRHGGES